MEKLFTTNETIKGIKGEKSKFLYSLFKSICKVSKNYIHYTYYVSSEPNEKSLAEESQVERVFAYELYHQWSNDCTIKCKPGLMINSELSKQLINPDNGEHLYYPDMVLHFGQGKAKDNLIVCELKRKEYIDANVKEMRNDFKKLKLYLDKETKAILYKKDWTPFELGVFVAIVNEDNCNDEFSVKIISKHFNEEIISFPKEIQKRIICVVYNGRELQYDTMYNMTNER